MKLLIVLLAVFAFASAGRLNARDASTRSAASQITDLLYSIQEQMPCGFEKYGIPPLAPLKVEHKQVAVEGETMRVAGEVNKATVNGLNEFEVTDMRVNVITSKVNFRLEWERIQVQGLYDLAAMLKSYGITVDIKGAGDMSLSIDGLAVEGVVKYSLGLISKQIKLKEVKIVVTIDDVNSEIEGLLGGGFANRKMNEFIEEFIQLSVNDNQELITKTIEDAVVPTVNEAVDGMSLGDLIAAIAGGDGEPKPVCTPP